MPQFSMQAAASRGGGDDEDEDDDDSHSVRSSYSTQSYASHASLAGMFLGVKGRRRYVVTKNGPKIITPAPATPGNNQPQQQNQANSNEGGKSKRNRKRKGKKAGETEAVIVPTKKDDGHVEVEEIPITKDTADSTKERAIKEFGTRLKNIWKSLRDNKKYGEDVYKPEDALFKAIVKFSSQTDNSPHQLADNYNLCIALLVGWQIKLKDKTPLKYIRESVKVPYLVMNLTTPDLVKAKIERMKVTPEQYRKYLWAMLTSYFTRGLDGVIFQSFDKLSKEQIEQRKKDKKSTSLVEIISESNENYRNIQKIYSSIDPWIVAYQKSTDKAAQPAKSGGGRSFVAHFGDDEFGEAED